MLKSSCVYAIFKKILRAVFYALADSGFLNWISDKTLIKMQYKFKIGKNLDISSPKTFNEKIQWLKLYGNLQNYSHLVDKYEVRKYIAETIGEEYLIPLIGVWDRFDDIDFEELPNQFALKCTHDSGSVIICTNKSAFNIKETKNKLNKCLKRNFYYPTREPQYKNIKPRIIGEKYMVDESGIELMDYKIFCFNGEPKIIQVNYNRNIDHRLNFYDTEWNYISIQLKPHLTDPTKLIDKPNNLDKMLTLAKTLSKNYPFVRVDFYSINDKIYFGELTFTPNAGYKEFEPEEFGVQLGNLMKSIPYKEFM